MRSLSVSVALVCALAACGNVKDNPDGGGGGDDVSGGDFTLSVDPTSLSIPIASSDTVTVTVARSGDVGDITLTAPGLPANLTATFTPSTLPAGSNTAELTLTAVGGMGPGTGTVTVHASGGGNDHEATVSVTTTTITVTGTIRGGRAGVRVGIIGKQSVLSGAGGVFSFTEVTPPYDLYTLAPAGCGTSMPPVVYYFDDLTRADPVVSAAIHESSCLFFFCPINGPSASVTGSKSGTGNNTDPVLFAWTAGGFSGSLNANGTFTGTARWCSGSTSTGTLQAIQFTKKANGAPNSFLGYAMSPTVTYDSGTSETTNLTFNAVNSSASISGTLNGPAGLPDPTVNLVQQFGNTYSYLWTTQTTAIDAAFPLIPVAGGNNLYAETSNSDGYSYFVQPLSATATVNFTMPAPSLLLTPAASVTGVTTTTPFSWTPPVGVVSQLTISGSITFNVFTTKSQATIPVIPEAALPSGASYSWSVAAYAPVSDINDAAATNELETVTLTDVTGPAHAISYSVSRSFTTQ